MTLRSLTGLNQLGFSGFMEAPADVRIVDAARTGNTDLVRSMLENGISVNSCRNLTRETALHVACFFNHSDVLKLLVDAGASINAVTRSQFTPLHYAADSGNLEDHDLQLLLLAGAEVTARDVDGNTPLHTSARMGRLNTFKILAVEGANAYVRELSGCSYLTASNNAGESPLSLVESRHFGTELHVWAMDLHQNINGKLFRKFLVWYLDLVTFRLDVICMGLRSLKYAS